MIFKSVKALNFFLEKGKVATMRDTLYKVGKKVIVKHGNRVVAKALVDKVVLNTDTMRIKYFDISGFDTLDEWLEEAIRLHKKVPRYIIILRLIRKYI